VNVVARVIALVHITLSLLCREQKTHNAQTVKRVAVIGTIILACACASVSEAATTKAARHSTKIHLCRTCTGSDPCDACKNCNYCKHCAKEGGTCGVCKR
jgi:hypothetical protein